MQQTITAFVLLLLTTLAKAQDGSLRGTVATEHGERIISASITISGIKKGNSTNQKGEFAIQGLKPGEHHLTISMIGYEPWKKNIIITAGEETVLNAVLKEASNQLQEIEIIGRKETGYKNTSSFIATKTATALKDVPQSISYVTKELMQDQAAARVGEVVKFMSGVNQFSFYDDLTIRGFRINGGNTTQLINGMRSFSGFWKQPMVNYLERVEVIKGPASALFGNASPGGTVNRVTKKPLEERRQSLSFSTGSFNTIRVLTDFTGPFDEEKKILYRLNLGYENAGSFRDLQFEKNFIVAPSVSFLPTERTRVNVDMVYNHSSSRLDRGQSVFNNSDVYSTPISLSLNATNDYLKEEFYTVMGSLNHRFNDRFSFSAGYLRSSYTEDLLEHRSANAYAKDKEGNPITSLVDRQVFNRKSRRYMDNLSAYLTYDLHTGNIKHRLLAGYDYGQMTTPPGSSQQTANNYLLKDGGSAPYRVKDSAKYVFYDFKTKNANGQDTTLRIPKPNVSSFDLSKSGNQFEDITKYFYTTAPTAPAFTNLHGFYVQDQISYGKWQVLLGLRYETYIDKNNYKTPKEEKVRQYDLMPRIGVVYSVTKNINVYGTYTEGYNPQTAAQQANPLAGGPFDPLESDLIEAGIKTEWFRGRLTANASVYRIRQRNALYNAGVAGQPDLMIQIGEEESKGVEFDVVGQITPNWNLLLNYAFNEAVLTKAGKADESIVGNQKPNAPRHQGGIWTKYQWRKGILQGFGIGAGSNFVTVRNVFPDASPTPNGPFTIPGYVIANAALYYRVDKFQLQLNLNNLFDKTYWVGGYDNLRLFPGAPRNWMTTVSYTF